MNELDSLLPRAKWAYTTRRVDRSGKLSVLPLSAEAKPGDLILARVASLGQHKRVQLAEGRTSTLFRDDLVVVCLGSRYAPDQFEAVGQITGETCDLVAGGGLTGTVRQKHAGMAKPTKLVPLGLIANGSGAPINISSYALPSIAAMTLPPVISVVGTSMNSGKTSAAANLMNGLTRAGLKVGATKVTGTGAFGDPNLFRDAGAAEVLDFTDCGYASTYGMNAGELDAVFADLVNNLAAKRVDVIVLEVADGLLQQETAMLIRSMLFKRTVSIMLFACSGALSAISGVTLLRSLGLPLRALTGILSRSPLAVLETRQQVSLPLLSRELLRRPEIASALLANDEATLMSAMSPSRAAEAGDNDDSGESDEPRDQAQAE